ncbi:MAG: precorrin-4 C(11)-methyltransferase [Propionibacteriaceae bacterium]
MTEPTKRGRYILVGAGPGATDLITIRGARAIAEADILIWASSLVQADIVANHKPGAILIDSATVSLEELVPYMERARDEGLTIARVHTGDPSIYGTTAEQRDVCNQLGLEHESIPGVSAFSACAAAADVEITVPEVSQSLILTRLDGGRTPMPPQEKVREFAAHGTTMALYLSAARNKQLQDELLAGGYPPETPCVIGHQVSWPDQMILRCQLSELSATMKAHQLWKHTVILVGPAMAEGPISARSHLYHPGFRHEYRDAVAEAQTQLRSEGAKPVVDGLIDLNEENR